MKKWLIVFAATIVLCILWFGLERVDIPYVESGKVFFRYAESDVQEVLSASDLSSISKMFAGKIVYKDMPSCGFSESVSIQINEGSQVFYVARDGCGVIYWKNADKYFKLSDNEIKILHSILINYGFSFPCV